MAKIKKTPPKPASDAPLWEKRAHDDAPTGEGNTLGEITGQPPKSTQEPEEANAIAKPDTQHEEGFWEGAFNSTKETAIEVYDDVTAVADATVDAGKGAIKSTWNFGVETVETLSKLATPAASAYMNQATMGQSLAGDNDAVERSLEIASTHMEEGADSIDLEPFMATIDNDAEEIGEILSDLNPKGLIKKLAKGGATVFTIITGKETRSSRNKSRTRRRDNRAAERDKKDSDKDSDELKKELKEKQRNRGGKVKGVKKTKVRCFDPYDSDRYKSFKTPKERKAFLDEYADQLRGQQAAINNMSPEIFQAARKAYDEDAAKAKEEKGKNGGGRHDKAEGAQRRARRNIKKQIKNNVYQKLRKQNVPHAEAKKIASEKADNALKGLAALHEPDMVAGGKNHYDPKRFGDKGINSAIGGSWKGDRLNALDEAAEEAIKNGLGDAKMNVQLEVCRKKGG